MADQSAYMQRIQVAAATFVTTFDECRKNNELALGGIPESMLYLALGGNPADLKIISVLVYLGIAQRMPGHVLVLGPKGEEVLANVRRLQAEGKLSADL